MASTNMSKASLLASRGSCGLVLRTSTKILSPFHHPSLARRSSMRQPVSLAIAKAFHQAKSRSLPVIDAGRNEQASPVVLPYTSPTSGLLSKIPRSWVPYAELVRLDKPAGTYYLFFPCLLSTLMAAPRAIGRSRVLWT